MSSAHGIPCTGSLAPDASCNFNVVFTPLGNDSPELAPLSVSDLDGSSPQRASLTGTATASNALFTITPIAANPAGSGCPPTTPDSASCTATVKSGQVATYTFQLTSVNGFNSPVPLKVSTALSNLPSNAGPMTFSSTSVVPSATGTTVTMTVGTQLSSQALLLDQRNCEIAVEHNVEDVIRRAAFFSTRCCAHWIHGDGWKHDEGWAFLPVGWGI
ncbi:MAG TPA: hypothetical protein VMG82_26650 [Candidatus Sulfotelmatobacter sp.]|nr:hypothetical protein [Candidatus Sulfotelmatobacter sp.]